MVLHEELYAYLKWTWSSFSKEKKPFLIIIIVSHIQYPGTLWDITTIDFDWLESILVLKKNYIAANEEIFHIYTQENGSMQFISCCAK